MICYQRLAKNTPPSSEQFRLLHVGKVDGRSELFERRDWLEECIEGHQQRFATNDDRLMPWELSVSKTLGRSENLLKRRPTCTSSSLTSKRLITTGSEGKTDGMDAEEFGCFLLRARASSRSFFEVPHGISPALC